MMTDSPKQKLDKQNNRPLLADKIALILMVSILSLSFVGNTFAQEQVKDQAKDQNKDAAKDSVDAKALEKAKKEFEKKNEKEIKSITDRISKKDDYVISIRSRFIGNAENLNNIANKINLRISKLEISGEDTAQMTVELNSAIDNIKKARKILSSLPNKKSLVEEDDAKKYASQIVETKILLEEAKTSLSKIIDSLKDLVIDKDNDKKD